MEIKLHPSQEHKKSKSDKATLGAMLIAIGVVYGDIGTSPMYVMKSILEGNGGIASADPEFMIGSFSLVIWTVTLLTTIKYVLLAMKADNHGEGGIFSLYSLVKKCAKWPVIPAMIGGSALLADGVLTPAVTVTTAIEGLRSIDIMDRLLGEGQKIIIIITLAIIAVLFAVQKAGTSKIGKAFGPVMLLWFSFLGITGIIHMASDLSVLKALNPIYAGKVLISPDNKMGFMILGSIFLATTGAEALYSDMGHVGKANIYASWPFVKFCLIANYGGQVAWIISNRNNAALQNIEGMNPFFLMLPAGLRPFAVLLSAAAAIIASQALITGSYTLVSEAFRLSLLPRMKVKYPSETKGQIYISLVNTILWIGCSLVVLYFRSSSRMESAYGLAITLTMLMTTLLLTLYLSKIKERPVFAVVIGLIFGALELVFFISSLGKFAHGGYVTVILALAILFIMIIWERGSSIEHSQRVMLSVRDYIPSLDKLRQDKAIPKFTDNMVFTTVSNDPEKIERDILYSLLDKGTKRADAYWFIHVNVTEKPFESNYTVETYGTDFVYFVRINLGFKVEQRVNVYLRQIVADLMASGELPKQEHKYSIYGPSDVGNFKFGFIINTLPDSADISDIDAFLISAKFAIRKIIGSQINWFGLENSSLVIEYVPLFIGGKSKLKLERRPHGLHND